MELDPEVAKLGHLLRQIEEKLAINGSTHWAAAIGRCRRSVEGSDAWGLHAFLGMFGGMGSLNDVVLTRDGHALANENNVLDALREEAWTLAKKLQREELAKPR